ncbi:hypothetical protein GCM10010442_18920 [Kitasatospora kifunensis]|uniref:Glycosyltransferase n=1 Tax=Kitasatospora kifunensis TaxID=58351 RepID=A0A7W7VXP6_KITKI|nr:hypothetical protein [Kitasatospora kifunensis]
MPPVGPTSHEPGDLAYDAALPFPVVRDSSRVLLSTARVARRALQIAATHGCDRVWFGAAAPLALMAPMLRRIGGSVTVLDGRTGQVVDGADPASTAAALTRILLDPQCAAMGAAGRRWVEESWSWEASARHLIDLLAPRPKRIGPQGC